jgi:hypothetical protein
MSGRSQRIGPFVLEVFVRGRDDRAETETETSALSQFESPKTHGGVERVRRDGAALGRF